MCINEEPWLVESQLLRVGVTQGMVFSCIYTDMRGSGKLDPPWPPGVSSLAVTWTDIQPQQLSVTTQVILRRKAGSEECRAERWGIKSISQRSHQNSLLRLWPVALTGCREGSYPKHCWVFENIKRAEPNRTWFWYLTLIVEVMGVGTSFQEPRMLMLGLEEWI